IAAAKIHRAIGDGSRRLDPDLIMDVGVFSRLEAPFLVSGAGVDGIEVTVPATNKDRFIGDRGRRMDDVVSVKSPLGFAAGGVKRVDIPVATAKINGSFVDRWR